MKSCIMKTSTTTRSSSKKENDSNDVTLMAEEEGLAPAGIKRGQGLKNRSNLVWIVSVLVIVAVTVGVIWSPIVNNVDNMDHNVDHKAYWQNEYDNPEKGTVLEPVCFVSGRDRNPIAVAAYNETHMVIDSNVVWERSGTVCTGQQNTVPDKRTLRENVRALHYNDLVMPTICQKRPLDCDATAWTIGARDQRPYKGHIHCDVDDSEKVHKFLEGMRFARNNFEMKKDFVVEHGSVAKCKHWTKEAGRQQRLYVKGVVSLLDVGVSTCEGNYQECILYSNRCTKTTGCNTCCT